MSGTDVREAARLLVDNSDALRRNVIDWLAANGIDAKDVPENPYASLVGDTLTIDMKASGTNGLDLIEPGTNPGEIMRITRTFTITAQPPADVAEWLMPRCENCGR